MKGTITNEQAIQMAWTSMQASKQSQRQFAKLLGVSAMYLNDMLHAKRGAGRIAAYFGYTIPTFSKEKKS
jgi:hypothetical protein